MMDDGSPPALPTNDCAASNARGIEARPARALRPSSERLGGIITLKCGTVASAGNVVSDEDPFRNVSDDILGDILARLSLFSLLGAKKVCKRWASVINTQEFNVLRKELNRKPLLVARKNSTSQFFAYDEEKDAWVILPGMQLPALLLSEPSYYLSIIGASGVVFFVAGPGKARLCYKLTSSASSVESFGDTWDETPVMRFPRADPVVSVALGAGRGHKVVVAGGGDDYGHSAVEVFDSEIGTWEDYGDLPEEFEYKNSELRLSGVVCDNKFYVSSLFKSNPDEVRIYSLDLYTKQWACMAIQLESRKDLRCSRLLAIGTTLVVAGTSSTDRTRMKLWKVDLKTHSLIQIGSTAGGRGSMIADLRPLTCMSIENVVYIYVNGDLLLVDVALEECRSSSLVLPVIPGGNFLERFVMFWGSLY